MTLLDETKRSIEVAERRHPKTPDGRILKVVLGAPLIVWQLAFFIIPMVLMGAMTFWVIKNFRMVPAAEWSNWTDTLTSTVFHDAFVRTLVLAVAAGVLSILLGLPLAYAIVRGLPPNLLRLALAGLIIPFFTSYLVRVFSWQFMLSDNGLINESLRAAGLDGASLLGSPVAIMVGYLTYSFPLITLILTLSILALDRRLEEAAMNLGHGQWHTITRVVIPALKPALVAAGTFAGILAFGDVVTPQVLGGGNFTVLGNLVVDNVKGGIDFPRAATVGMIMVITIMLAVFASFKLTFTQEGK